MRSSVERTLCNECARYNWVFHLTRHIQGAPRDALFQHENYLAEEAIRIQREVHRSQFLDPSDGWCWVNNAPYSGHYQVYEDRSATKVILGPIHSSVLIERRCTFCRLMLEAIEAGSLDKGASDHETSSQLRQIKSSDFWIMQLVLELRETVRNMDYDPPVLMVIMDTEINHTRRQLKFGFGPVDYENGLSSHSMLNPHQIEFGQIMHWLKICKSEHADGCKPEIHHIIPNFKVIDVINNRVVLGPTGCTYIALSYVWGLSQPIRLRSMDFKAHESRTNSQPAFTQLDRDKLPRTIRDAMSVVAVLGEQYLWVDSLCIAQDDKDEMKVMIDAMDNVYKAATLAIIAAGGENQEAGLAGLYPGSRSVRYATWSVEGVQLVSTERSLQLNLSSWAKRAWTCQEYQFSTRSLIFINGHIFFECANAVFGEANPDRPMSTTSRGRTRSIDFTHTLGAQVTHAIASFLSYCHHVQEYTSRSLSHEGDVLNTFSAILQDHSARFGTGFCWGLPTQHFLDAMLWTNGRYCSKTRRSLRRRTGVQKECAPFPSWSWTGWIGQVHYSQLDKNICFSDTLQSYITWPWDSSYGQKDGEVIAFEKGVLVLDVQCSMCDSFGSSFSHLDIMCCKFDDATQWRSGVQECFLIARDDARAEVQDNECIPRNHILIAVKQDSSGTYYRSGLFRVQESCWMNAHIQHERIWLG